MKYLIAVPVWNKEGMVSWLMEGISQNINPADADVAFFFTNCKDESLEVFLENRHLLKDFQYFIGRDQREGRWELDHHNTILKQYQDLYKAVIITQDDNRIEGKRLIADVDNLINTHGDSLGLIGGRDGYSYYHREMVGSPHSRSVLKARTLEIGESSEAIMLNTGPLVYRRGLTDRVGYNDEDNKIYAMDDYSLRCRQNGLKNFVLGMDIDHRKFGKHSDSDFPPNIAGNCLGALNARWLPILGHSVH